MARKTKKKGFMAFFYDLAYSFPFLRGILGIFLTFIGEIYRQPDPENDKQKPRYYPSRFDILMLHLSYVIVNGALLAVPICLIFQIPFRLEYVFGLGIARYMVGDLLTNLLWKPLIMVARTRRGK
jgi:hypothetical protein